MPTAFPDVLPETDTDTRTKRQPPYAVVLHNDDVNTMDFVVLVLRKVFGYTPEKCVGLMFEAHEQGKAVVWVGPARSSRVEGRPGSLVRRRPGPSGVRPAAGDAGADGVARRRP